MIASLGGFLGRKGDGEPGTTTTWRGLQRLQDITTGFMMFKYLQNARAGPETTALSMGKSQGLTALGLLLTLIETEASCIPDAAHGQQPFGITEVHAYKKIILVTFSVGFFRHLRDRHTFIMGKKQAGY